MNTKKENADSMVSLKKRQRTNSTLYSPSAEDDPFVGDDTSEPDSTGVSGGVEGKAPNDIDYNELARFYRESSISTLADIHPEWRLVLLHSNSKVPSAQEWQKLNIAPNDVLEDIARGKNVGVLLGSKSGHLVDVDLDSPGALRVAPYFLPATKLRHGYASKPKSHYFYIAPSDEKTIRLLDAGGSCLVELRNGTDKSGAFTMIPPSIHPNGERLEWYGSTEDAPTKVDYEALKASVHRIAGVTMILPHWRQGSRNELSLALSGAMAKRGVPLETAKQILTAICESAKDKECSQRIKALFATYNKHAKQEDIVGDSKLKELLPEALWKKLSAYLFYGFSVPSMATKPQPEDLLVESEDRNDVTLVNILLEHYRDDMRYCYEDGHWYVWNGKVWEIDRRESRHQRVMKAIDEHRRQLRSEDDSKEIKGLCDWLGVCLKYNRINAVLDLAKTYPNIQVNLETLYQSKHLISFDNGTLNLNTLELQPHNPNDYICRKVPFNYVPEAKCPRFHKYLNRVFEEDQQVITFVQKLMGYTLLGSNPEHKIVFFYGTGSNGKSILLSIMLKLLGSDYAKTCAASSLVKQSYKGNTPRDDLAALRGKRMVVASEFNEDQELDESLLKQLSGNDEISCRELYKEQITYTPEFLLFTSTNYQPKINGTDEGIWRRICMIKFPVTIPEQERDLQLEDKLLEEAEGILAFAVEGLGKYNEEGFATPVAVLDTIASYREDMDPVKLFLNERVQKAPGERIQTSELYSVYQSWAHEYGLDEMTVSRFKQKMKNKGYVCKRQSKGMFWFDIRLSDVPALPSPTTPTGQAIEMIFAEQDDESLTPYSF